MALHSLEVVHAQLAAMVDQQDLAWSLYQEALYSDYRDIQGGEPLPKEFMRV